MADGNNPGSPPIEGAPPAGGAPPASPPPPLPPPAATERPTWAPEKFWDSGKGELRAQDLAKAHGELEAKLGKGKDALKAELDAERAKNRPARPEDYAIKLPEKGAPADLVLLDKAPGDDFKPEAGKKYFVVDKADPLLKFWRDHAHAVGMNNDDFMQGVVQFAEAQSAKEPTAEEIKVQNEAVYAKLGEHGKQRAAHAWGKLVALVGEPGAKAIENTMGDADAIVAIETLLEKAGAPKFAAGSADAGGGEQQTVEQLRAIMAESDYATNKDKQQRVADGFKKLYPGKTQTAQLNRRG